MFRIELSSFRTRAARRLFLVFAACAIVPVMATGALAYHELTRLLRQSATQRLADYSANYGLTLIDRLTQADGVLQALAQSADSATEVVRRTQGTGLFLDARVVPSADWPAATLVVKGTAEESFSLYLSRTLPGQTGRLVAQLDPRRLWGVDDDLPLGLGVLVVSSAGELLHASALPASFAAAVQRSVREHSAANGRPESSTWQSPDPAWQTSQWRAFLGAAFDARTWTVVTTEPAPSVFGSAAQLTLLFPLLLVASAVAALLLSIWQIRRYLRPMENLLEGTRRLARREFDTTVAVSAQDEFGELAASFNTMTASIRRQFDVLEAAADVDRLLLQSTDLEQVLDRLLPQLASILGCRTVSVLLVDRDASDQARLYDFADHGSRTVELRRIVADLSTLQDQPGSEVCATIGDEVPPGAAFLHALRGQGARHFQLWPLRHGGELAGMLCLGFAREPAGSDDTAHARGFADRLAVVLANVAYDQRLYRQAHYDSLTELPNRQLFRERLVAELESALHEQSGALLYIDLDHFKRVNDTAGHSAGDELLRIVAQRISAVVKPTDTVARLGGDEFAVVLSGASSPQVANQVAERVIATLERPIGVGGRDFRVGASVGITVFPQDGRTLEELLKNGDLAMYRAKELGRGRAVFYEPEMQSRVAAHSARITALHQAVKDRQFELHYLPIVSAADGRLLGAEALMRWYANGVQYCGPDDFIPVAEETGLIVEMGSWALQEACRQMAVWREQGLVMPYVSVNVSARQLHDEAFATRLAELLRSYQMQPGEMQIEIVERVIAEGSAVEQVLRDLAALGVRLALDDFGTGYSSLSYLRTFPIHCVKIDRSFINDTPQDRDACSLVETIIAMAHTLQKYCVAEGVETAEQRDFLKSRGCEGLQGYLISRPKPARDFTAMLLAAPAASRSQRYA